ncbi:hypothetical protein BG004_006394 [Podila humilis]|nr:hypothetical protein BG004_006394 [Podila humilis]
MGRPTGRNLDDELLAKIKVMFDRFHESDQKDNPEIPFDFALFVDLFDDSFSTKVFEFLVKETALRYRNSQAETSLPPNPSIRAFLSGHNEFARGAGQSHSRRSRSSNTTPRDSLDSNISHDTNNGENSHTNSSYNNTNNNNTTTSSSTQPVRTAVTGSGSGSSPGQGSARRASRRAEILERQRAFIWRPLGDLTSMESWRDDMADAESPFQSLMPDVPPPPSGTSSLNSSETNLLRPPFTQERTHQLHQLFVQDMLARNTRRARQHPHGRGTPEPASRTSSGRTPPPAPRSFPSSSFHHPPPSPQQRSRPDNALLITSANQTMAERAQEFREIAGRARAVLRNSLADNFAAEEVQMLRAGEISRRRRRRVSPTPTTMLSGSEDTNTFRFESFTAANQDMANSNVLPTPGGVNGSANDSDNRTEAASTSRNHRTPSPLSSTMPDRSSLRQDAGQQDHLQSQGGAQQQDQVQNQVQNQGQNQGQNQNQVQNQNPVQNQAPARAQAQVLDQQQRVPEHGQGQGRDAMQELEQGQRDNGAVSPLMPERHQDVQPAPAPPTPPSPNPNRNPRPTFQDRRRSSINPADIEAVVRQLEATASGSIVQRSGPQLPQIQEGGGDDTTAPLHGSATLLLDVHVTASADESFAAETAQAPVDLGSSGGPLVTERGPNS